MTSTASFVSQWSFDVMDYENWRRQLDDVLTVLQTTTGFETLTLLHSPDEPNRYQVQCRWVDVGSYRRGISSTNAKMTIWPFLASMIDGPSAFETLLVATETHSDEFETSVENQ